MTRVIVTPKKFKLGRKLVAFKKDVNFAQYKTIDGNRIFSNEYTDVWPVDETCPYAPVEMPDKDLHVIKRILIERFVKQNKPKSYMVDFFSPVELTDEEKETIDKENKPLSELFSIDFSVPKESELAPIDLINEKTNKATIVKVLGNNGVDASMRYSKEALMKKVEEVRASRK
jgi:hypothetical protein